MTLFLRTVITPNFFYVSDLAVSDLLATVGYLPLATSAFISPIFMQLAGTSPLYQWPNVMGLKVVSLSFTIKQYRRLIQLDNFSVIFIYICVFLQLPTRIYLIFTHHRVFSRVSMTWCRIAELLFSSIVNLKTSSRHYLLHLPLFCFL